MSVFDPQATHRGLLPDRRRHRLGILPSHPLWRELRLTIIKEGGNLAGLVTDIISRAFGPAAGAPAALPGPVPRFPAPSCTGPP